MKLYNTNKFARRTLAVATALVLAGTAAGCSTAGGTPSSTNSSGSTAFAPTVAKNPTFDAGTTMATLAKAGTITVGVKFDQPGFGLKDLNGKVAGLDIDLAELIAADLGIPQDKINFVESVSANRIPFLQQHKVDIVVATFGISADYQTGVTFAGPYLTEGQTLMVKAGNPEKIASLDDLAGKNVCVISGGDSQTLLPTTVPTANLIAFDVASKCQTALKNGQVDAFSSAAGIIGGLVSQDKANVGFVDFQFGSKRYGVGLEKGDVKMCEFVNSVLDKASKDGEWQKAYDETYGKLIPTGSSVVGPFIPCE
jgi:glutamate transport system substrate-binding protein